MLRKRLESVAIVVLIIMAILVALATGLKNSGLIEDHYVITTSTGETIYDGPAKWNRSKNFGSCFFSQ